MAKLVRIAGYIVAGLGAVVIAAAHWYFGIVVVFVGAGIIDCASFADGLNRSEEIDTIVDLVVTRNTSE